MSTFVVGGAVQDYPCDVCGNPASTAARDSILVPTQGPYEEWRPSTVVKFGCAEHPAQSVEIR